MQPCARCIIDASGVEPKAAPGGQDGRIRGMSDGGIDAGEPGGGEPPRRLSGGRCGRSRGQSCAARCRRRRRCGAKCGRAPQERPHECGGHCARWCASRCAAKPAPGDAPVRSTVRRRVSRQRNGAATAPKAEARSAMAEATGAVRAEANAPAIGERQRAGARARREARARTASLRHRCAKEETGRAAAGATTRPAMRCGQAARRTGMPSCRALSTRFSVMPLHPAHRGHALRVPVRIETGARAAPDGGGLARRPGVRDPALHRRGGAELGRLVEMLRRRKGPRAGGDRRRQRREVAELAPHLPGESKGADLVAVVDTHAVVLRYRRRAPLGLPRFVHAQASLRSRRDGAAPRAKRGRAAGRVPTPRGCGRWRRGGWRPLRRCRCRRCRA